MVLFDFSKEETIQKWDSRDDGVMGGKSNSVFRSRASTDTGLFVGNVTKENFGGFCYTEGPKTEEDLSQYKAFKIEVKSSGTGFRLLVYTSDRNKSYRSGLMKTSDEFETIRVPFNELYPYFWGWKNPFATMFRPKNFEGIGFQTQYKATGKFQIEFKTVEVV